MLMDLPALVVSYTARGSTAALATSRSGLGRDGAALAEALLTRRALTRGSGITTEELAGTAETEVGTADIERARLEAVLAVHTARRLRIAVGDARLLAVLGSVAALTCILLAALMRDVEECTYLVNYSSCRQDKGWQRCTEGQYCQRP